MIGAARSAAAEATAAMLGSWGCDYLQGALIGLAAAERPWRETPPAAIPA
jgi:EAL domain-containing protein (putative c-di-GMP-specific phosphodiesterase class I)